MSPTYLIVTTGAAPVTLPDRAAFDAWIADRGLAATGAKAQRGSHPLRAEILGQPLVAGLSGPAYEGPGVCRYEGAVMLDTAGLRAHLAVAAARVLEDLEAEGAVADQLDVADLGERVLGYLDDLVVMVAAALGRGRTAAGDALADRLWADLGIEARL